MHLIRAHPAVPLRGIIPQRYFHVHKTCTKMFISALFLALKNRNQTKYPLIGKWISNLGYFHAMEYYVALVMNELDIYNSIISKICLQCSVLFKITHI